MRAANKTLRLGIDMEINREINASLQYREPGPFNDAAIADVTMGSAG